MNPSFEINPVHQLATTIASGGTATATGVSWTDTYEPTMKAVVSVDVAAAGALIVNVQTSAASGSGYANVGTISCGSIAGIYSLDLGSIVQQYARVTATATGGTTSAAVSFLGKKRTVT